MAHLHSGIMGPVSGKIGNLVYYTTRGKCFVRRAPAKTKKRPTLKQQAQRDKFSLAMRFISPLSRLINESYRLINRRRMGVNVMIRDILHTSIIGKQPHFFIDYAQVNLLRGTLPWSMGSLFHLEGSCKLELSWQVLANPVHLEDELIVLIYCCTTGNWFVAEGACHRAEGNCSLRIQAPVERGRLQVWMAFRSPDSRSFSNSEYLGEVITSKTPSYEN